MTVWSVRKRRNLKIILLAQSKKAAVMQLQRRIDDGRLEGTAEDYIIIKEED